MRNFNSGKYFKLTNDIYLNYGKFVQNETTGEVEYFSRKDKDDLLCLWSDFYLISSNFDGNGFTIFGIYTDASLLSMAYSTIKNFNVENAYSTRAILVKRVENWGNTSIFSYVENITVKGFLVGGKAVFCDDAQFAIFSNCTNYAKLINSDSYTAGLVYNSKGGNFINCVNFGSGAKRAGIVGNIQSNNNKEIYVTGCKNYADVRGSSSDVGGILGQHDGLIVIKNCQNFGKISTNSYGLGGIAGYANGSIENCENYGTLSGAYARIGGILGRGGKSIIGCKNYGDLPGSDYTGGIVGEGSPIIINCKNYGDMPKTRDSSGFVGNGSPKIIADSENHGKCVCGFAKSTSGTIYNCKNYANTTYAFVATLNNKGIIKECEATGNFTYYVGKTLNSGGIIKNCIIRGFASSLKGIADTNNATINGLLFIGKINNVEKNQFYGDDFSAFYINRKKGIIGLKSLDDAGVYGLCVVTEQYLLDSGFEKLG